MKKIGVLVGSLRKGSYNKKVAEFMMSKFPDDFQATMMDISSLPFYNEDLDHGNPPQAWTTFRQQIHDMDAFLFVTPEYNRSVPAALKNALDVASRPYGENCWDNKPGGLVSVSVGNIGGFGANHHFRQSMVFLNLHMMAQPEAYISDITQALDENEQLTNERTQDYLRKITESYIDWVRRF